MIRRTPSHRRAFTLLELLVSLALIAALASALFAFLLDNLDARARAREIAGRHRAVTILFDQLEGDLMTCLVGTPSDGPGIDGDNQILRLLTRSVPVALAGKGSTDASQNAMFGDLLQSEYTFDEVTGAITIQRRPAGQPSSDAEDLGTTWFRARFRYHDGSAWNDSFDSHAADQLPRAIEVMIWFHPWPGEQPLDRIDADPTDDSDRLTFDDSTGFDEFDIAMQSDIAEFEDEPRPDRMRIFAIPDAAPNEHQGNTDDAFAAVPLPEDGR